MAENEWSCGVLCKVNDKFLESLKEVYVIKSSIKSEIKLEELTLVARVILLHRKNKGIGELIMDMIKVHYFHSSLSPWQIIDYL